MTLRSQTALLLSGLALLALGAGSCTAPPTMNTPYVPPPAERDRLVAMAYPTLAEIYQGAQGIYRGCGPNGNVCHNSRQYPNMNTLGALSLIVNQPCNQLQDDPTRIDDWCERQGDTVRMGDQRRTLAYLQQLSQPTETQGARWAIAVQGDLPALGADTNLAILRVRQGSSDNWLAGFDGAQLQRDPMRPNVVIAQLAPGDDYVEGVLERAGIPAERDAIQFGDPNRNGVFGVTLGTALVVAGHPERSYIIRRLTDPTAGPLMPLANCCFWSKTSLRALWCWIANLHDDGSNAMAPIDYSMCPDGPVENVVYPDPGPTCENAGLCPVRSRGAVPDDPTWANVYANILVPRCGGDGCHRSTPPAGTLDLGTMDLAYQQLVHSTPPRVVPGNAALSLLYRRLTQACTAGESCRRMPLYQAPMPDNELSIISRWIASGARQDGTVMDGGMTEGGMPDASEGGVPDVAAPDVTDMGTAETTPDVAAPDASDVQAPDVPDVQSPDAGPEAGMEAATDAPGEVGSEPAGD